MKTTYGNFQGFFFWIPTRKDNKVAGTICFEVRIATKTENCFVKIPFHLFSIIFFSFYSFICFEFLVVAVCFS